MTFAQHFSSTFRHWLGQGESRTQELERLVSEMRTERATVSQRLRGLLTKVRQAQRSRQDAQQQLERWARRAELALSAGDEELARVALRRREDHRRRLEDLAFHGAKLESGARNMTDRLRDMDEAIGEALRARALSRTVDKALPA